MGAGAGHAGGWERRKRGSGSTAVFLASPPPRRSCPARTAAEAAVARGKVVEAAAGALPVAVAPGLVGAGVCPRVGHPRGSRRHRRTHRRSRRPGARRSRLRGAVVALPAWVGGGWWVLVRWALAGRAAAPMHRLQRPCRLCAAPARPPRMQNAPGAGAGAAVTAPAAPAAAAAAALAVGGAVAGGGRDVRHLVFRAVAGRGRVRRGRGLIRGRRLLGRPVPPATPQRSPPAARGPQAARTSPHTPSPTPARGRRRACPQQPPGRGGPAGEACRGSRGRGGVRAADGCPWPPPPPPACAASLRLALQASLRDTVTTLTSRALQRQPSRAIGGVRGGRGRCGVRQSPEVCHSPDRGGGGAGRG